MESKVEKEEAGLLLVNFSEKFPLIDSSIPNVNSEQLKWFLRTPWVFSTISRGSQDQQTIVGLDSGLLMCTDQWFQDDLISEVGLNKDDVRHYSSVSYGSK